MITSGTQLYCRLMCLPRLSSLAPWSSEEDFFWHRLTRVVPEKGP